MSLLIFYLSLALAVSFFCSIAEAVLLSVRPSYVAALKRKGRKSADVLENLKNNLDRPLAAILTLNTIAHTVGAVGVGAQAVAVFGNAYTGVVSGILTILILVVSEIIPKTLGATYWQRLAPALGPAIAALTVALGPFVWASGKLTRLFSKPGTRSTNFSREELEAMVRIGRHEGHINAQEMKVVSNLLKLRALSVRQIMTPRSVIFSVPETMTVDQFFDNHADKPFSRIPLHAKSREDISGYVLKTDLLIGYSKNEGHRTLSEFERNLLAVPEVAPVAGALDSLLRERSHVALVVDEYGSVQGLVTLEDIVETLIGIEITDELDTVDDMQKVARQRWRKRISEMGVNPDEKAKP